MSKLIDLTGERYGMLTVLCREANQANGVATWRCRCDCGNTVTVRGNNLKTGAVKSCGCLRGIANRKRSTHNMSKSKLYWSWVAIRARCYYENQPAYKAYGGRGIKMCDEWKMSFENFSKWAFSNGYKDGLTIERIDVNGNYCPENCKWIPLSEQAKNRRSNILIEYNGDVHCLSEWCDIYKKDYRLVYNRIHKNKWSFERAIFEPVHIEKRNRKE